MTVRFGSWPCKNGLTGPSVLKPKTGRPQAAISGLIPRISVAFAAVDPGSDRNKRRRTHTSNELGEKRDDRRSAKGFNVKYLISVFFFIVSGVAEAQDLTKYDSACADLISSMGAHVNSDKLAGWAQLCSQNPDGDSCDAAQKFVVGQGSKIRMRCTGKRSGLKSLVREPSRYDDACASAAAALVSGAKGPDFDDDVKLCTKNPVKGICEATQQVLDDRGVNYRLVCTGGG